ncbi:hypothetical protein EI94DRAFT_1741717 [Lactarius quietus]|nr:hypothetical protein EI94DRAFT_1741717 [Lactarius quietus]
MSLYVRGLLHAHLTPFSSRRSLLIKDAVPWGSSKVIEPSARSRRRDPRLFTCPLSPRPPARRQKDRRKETQHHDNNGGARQNTCVRLWMGTTSWLCGWGIWESTCARLHLRAAFPIAILHSVHRANSGPRRKGLHFQEQLGARPVDEGMVGVAQNR